MESLVLSVICMTAEGPKLMYIGRFDYRCAEVKPVRGVYDKPLWIPRDMIFTSDKAPLGELQVAWREKDEAKLANLWKQASLWSPESATG
jgi:hypothetical protein